MLTSLSERGGKRVTMLDARLHDLAGKALDNLGSLGDAAPFCDQARHIDACGKITAGIQCFYMESDCCFVHDFVLAPVLEELAVGTSSSGVESRSCSLIDISMVWCSCL